MRTKWTWLGWSAPIFPFMTPAASWLAGRASSPLVGFDRLALYNLMVECPCKENRPNSGWLMTQSHSGRGFGFFFAQLAGWLDGWPVCSPVRQTGSHCGNLDSKRPTNRRSGFIPVMRRWAVEKRKCLEAVESWTKPQLDGWWGGKNGCMSKHNIWYGGYLWISKCWLKWTNY